MQLRYRIVLEEFHQVFLQKYVLQYPARASGLKSIEFQNRAQLSKQTLIFLSTTPSNFLNFCAEQKEINDHKTFSPILNIRNGIRIVSSDLPP